MDEEFHFWNGEILMKETFLFFLSGRKDMLHDGKLFWVEKRGKKKCEILSQWHFKINLHSFHRTAVQNNWDSFNIIGTNWCCNENWVDHRAHKPN